MLDVLVLILLVVGVSACFNRGLLFVGYMMRYWLKIKLAIHSAIILLYFKLFILRKTSKNQLVVIGFLPSRRKWNMIPVKPLDRAISNVRVKHRLGKYYVRKGLIPPKVRVCRDFSIPPFPRNPYVINEWPLRRNIILNQIGNLTRPRIN